MSVNLADSNAAIIRIPNIAFDVITPLIVSIRIFSRLRGGTRLGADDWVILVATIFGLASNNVLIAACHYGYGLHGAALSSDNKASALMYFYLSQLFYKTSINTTKASILLLYLRIFVQKKFRLICWILLGFVVAFGIATITASLFQCTPIPRTYDKSIPGTCISTIEFWYANAAISILGDVIVLSLPMPLIMDLKLQLNQKLSLVIVFALGIFIVITSILRMTALNTTSASPDPTWDVRATMWTTVELNIAIICACLPMCRMPLAKLFPKLFASTSKSHNTNAFKYAGSSKNNWTPGTEGRGLGRSQLASVIAGDNSSEDFILQDDHGTMLHPMKDEARIKKTTQFEVRYEDSKSDISGEMGIGKNESNFGVREMR